MEGYKKTAFINHKGETLFPWTTASMVSEESDRRFVDNIEKETLNKIATGGTALAEILAEHPALMALASEEIAILNLLDSVPGDLREWNDILQELAVMMPHTTELLALIGARPTVKSETTGFDYSIGVDDSDLEAPRLTLVRTEPENNQPNDYSEGVTWLVPMNAPDVKIEVPVKKIVFDNSRKTILTFAEATAKEGVPNSVLNNIINGAQQEGVEATGENIAQTYTQFDVADYLTLLFENSGKEELEKTISRFNIEILSQPLGTTTLAKTQTYLDGNVVQPTRESAKKNDYTTNSFSHLTWQTSIDTDFVNQFLNKDGKAAIAVYGGPASEISISRPTLTIYVENPYKGKTLRAKASSTGEFNILDWELVE